MADMWLQNRLPHQRARDAAEGGRGCAEGIVFAADGAAEGDTVVASVDLMPKVSLGS